MQSNQKFRFDELASIISRPEDNFESFGTVVTLGHGEGSTYTYKDNESNVLGVAHLDTVCSDGWATLIRVKGERVIISPRLDDRLGVYIITKLLPKLGVTCDWLLTTGEESGMSSAEHFVAGKTYNWAFSFDRRGTDAVLYHYDHKALRKVLRKAGFQVGQGSFSDLSTLDVGCSGINFGCGYHDEHSQGSYAVLSDTLLQVHKFARFWRMWKDRKLPYNPRARWGSYRSAYGGYQWPYGSNGGYPEHNKGYSVKQVYYYPKKNEAEGETYPAAYYHGKQEYLDWAQAGYGYPDEDDDIILNGSNGADDADNLGKTPVGDIREK